MDKRIVRLEDGFWKISTETGGLSKLEQEELEEYFNEIRMPYRIISDSLCISGVVDRDAIFERMKHFYDGRADVYPF